MFEPNKFGGVNKKAQPGSTSGGASAVPQRRDARGLYFISIGSLGELTTLQPLAGACCFQKAWVG